MEHVEHANFFVRTGSDPQENAGIPIEMGGHADSLVDIIACHYSIELIDNALLNLEVQIDRLLMMGLSSDPEHELVPPADFVEFMGHQAIYAKSQVTFNGDTTVLTTGAAGLSAVHTTQIIPCYGITRPRRQIWVHSVINGEAATGLVLEVWYRPKTDASKTERDTINRKFGRYRRS